jgi:hypothetical protein
VPGSPFAAGTCGGPTGQLESFSNRLRTPASIKISEGQTDAEFPIGTLVSDHDEVVSLRIFTSDASAVQSIPIRGVRLVSLACRENLVASGQSTVCEVRLNAVAPTDRMELGITSSSAALKVPLFLSFRAADNRVSCLKWWRIHLRARRRLNLCRHRQECRPTVSVDPAREILGASRARDADNSRWYCCPPLGSFHGRRGSPPERSGLGPAGWGFLRCRNCFF